MSFWNKDEPADQDFVTSGVYVLIQNVSGAAPGGIDIIGCLFIWSYIWRLQQMKKEHSPSRSGQASSPITKVAPKKNSWSQKGLHGAKLAHSSPLTKRVQHREFSCAFAQPANGIWHPLEFWEKRVKTIVISVCCRWKGSSLTSDHSFLDNFIKRYCTRLYKPTTKAK